MQKLITKKKGYQIGDLLPLAITFVVIAVAISLGADVLDDIQGTQDANSTAYNATGYGLQSMNTFAKWLPTIALVIVIAVIIGILIVYLANRFARV
tara:strand:+ start:548 stop:835 length:288 start_codon:yes stop_codon:yes gene_type:complete